MRPRAAPGDADPGEGSAGCSATSPAGVAKACLGEEGQAAEARATLSGLCTRLTLSGRQACLAGRQVFWGEGGASGCGARGSAALGSFDADGSHHPTGCCEKIRLDGKGLSPRICWGFIFPVFGSYSSSSQTAPQPVAVSDVCLLECSTADRQDLDDNPA